MTNSPPPLISLRAAVIGLLAVLVGVATAALTHLAHNSVPEAVLAGGSAFAATLVIANTLISP